MQTLRAFSVTAIALITLTCSAGPPTPHDPGRQSGAQVVAKWLGEKNEQKTPAELHETQFIDGYLAGVADATEGIDWCNKRRTKAHEIDAFVVWAMRDLPKREQETSRAAKLMVQLLAERYPCSDRNEPQ